MTASPDKASAVVASDVVAAGQVVHFEPTRLRFTFDGRAGALDDFRAPDGMVLGVMAGSGARTQIHGSAVLVAPGVALCARHVVEPYFAFIEKGEVALMCFAVASHGVNLWRVRHVTTARFADAVFLAVEPASVLPPNSKYRQAAITTRFLRAGDRLLCLGFCASQEEFVSPAPPADRSPREHYFDGQVIASSGTVTEVFPNGRDKVLLPWPSVEVDFPAWGGMSGGPVFDAQGDLVGLLCRSWSTGGEPSPSYVSLVYPLLADRFLREWPPLGHVPPYVSLLEMDQRLCSIAGRDAIQQAEDGGLTYKVWY